MQLESENGELTKELAEMRQKCEEAVQGREEQQKSSEAILAEVRSQSAREVERCREEADRARETQLREKEGFDTQVSGLLLLYSVRGPFLSTGDRAVWDAGKVPL